MTPRCVRCLSSRCRSSESARRAVGPFAVGSVVRQHEVMKTVWMARSLRATVATSAAWWAVHCSSPSVRSFTPPSFPGTRHGELWARSRGDSSVSIVLLHGLLSSGDVFGGMLKNMPAQQRVVVPDLLGFGRSLAPERAAFPPEAHLEALDHLADRLDLFGRDGVVVGAHSMGCALAVMWAARHPSEVRRVVCFGAPVQRSAIAARTAVAGTPMASLFGLNRRLAAGACRLSCRHRRLAGWLSALASPRLPAALARQAPLHTWPAYRDAVTSLVIEMDWHHPLADLAKLDVTVDLAHGERDDYVDRQFVHELCQRGADSAEAVQVSSAGHRLPLTHPRTCARLVLRDLSERTPGSSSDRLPGVSDSLS